MAGCLFFFAFAAVTAWRTPAHALLFLLPSLLHDLAMSAGFMLRRPLQGQARGWRPSALAYACTFLVLGFVGLASNYRPQWVAVTPNHVLARSGLLIWSIGTVLAVWTVWVLRRAFSLVPQARLLVTRGPFRIARHPIYASYMLQYFGLWLVHDTWQLAVVLALWTALTLARIRAEETVLAASFPEYTAYSERVPAFGVRMPRRLSWHRRPARVMAATAAASSPGTTIPKAG